MASRSELHNILVDILGTTRVYFQPPASLTLKYPCIIYKRVSEKALYADNNKYNNKKRYSITVIDRNPDSEIPDAIGALPYCSFDRYFTADNLHHDVYNIFF